MTGTTQSLQLDLMLILSGISAATAFFMALSKTLDRERKLFLILTNIFTVLLLYFDRLEHFFNGDPSATGYWMVRISNFIQFSMVILIIWAFNHYIRDIYIDETGLKKIPVRLTVIDILVIIGLILLCISQFTGLYYTIDANNVYHRSPGYMIGMIIPLVVLVLQLSLML